MLGLPRCILSPLSLKAHSCRSEPIQALARLDQFDVSSGVFSIQLRLTVDLLLSKAPPLLENQSVENSLRNKVFEENVFEENVLKKQVLVASWTSANTACPCL